MEVVLLEKQLSPSNATLDSMINGQQIRGTAILHAFQPHNPRMSKRFTLPPMSTWFRTFFPPAFALLLLAGCGRSPEALTRTGIEALNRGKHNKAVSRLERARKKWPDDAPASDTARMYSALALARGRLNPADPGVESALRLAIDAAPEAHDPAYNLGVWLLAHGDAEAGRDLLERAAELGVDKPDAPLALARHALDNDDPTAAALWSATARSRAETAPILVTWAAARASTASVNDRRAALEAAVALDPHHAPAHLRLAALLDRHRLAPEQAVSHYEAYAGLKPESPENARVRQRVQVLKARSSSGRFTREDPARREVQDKLDEAKAAANRGEAAQALRACLEANRAADRAGREDLKERALRAAATLVPDSPRGPYGLGRILLAQGRKSEALPHLLKAQRLAPSWPPALAPAVELAVELGQRETARNVLRAAEAPAGGNPGFLLEVARLYTDALKEPGEARRLRRLWLNRFPDHPRRAEVETLLDE